MGSVFSIRLWAEDPAKAEMALDEIIDELKMIDSLVDGRPESELTRLNLQHGQGEVSVSPLLFEWIYFSSDLSARTHGLMDMTVGSLMRLWGFYEPLKGEPKELPKQSALESLRSRVGSKRVTLEKERQSVRLPEGVEIDLSSTAKGYALDRAAGILDEFGMKSAHLSLGDRHYFLGLAPDGEKWTVHVKSPRFSNETAFKLEVEEGAVTTVRDDERYFSHQGKRYPHVIDPRTGWPAREVHSVTVWSKTGIEADAWAVALFVAGVENGLKILEDEKDIAAIWIKLRDETIPLGKSDVFVRDSKQLKLVWPSP